MLEPDYSQLKLYHIVSERVPTYEHIDRELGSFLDGYETYNADVLAINAGRAKTAFLIEANEWHKWGGYTLVYGDIQSCRRVTDDEEDYIAKDYITDGAWMAYHSSELCTHCDGGVPGCEYCDGTGFVLPSAVGQSE